MQIIPVTTVEGAAELQSHWNGLAGGLPFRRYEWLMGWWQHYGQGNELHLLAAYSAGKLVGIAPWIKLRSWRQGRVLRFLGAGEICSDHVSLLVDPAFRDAALQAWADYLLTRPTLSDFWSGEAIDGSWDCLELSAVDQDDPLVAGLAERLAQQGCLVDRHTTANTWRLELPATWDEYLAGLSKSHRKQLRRLERVLDTGGARLRTAATLPEWDAGWRVLVDLHQRRRRRLGESGCFSSAAFAAFHEAWSRTALAEGRLRLHWIERAGQPIAAEYHFSDQQTVYGYQSGLDPEALDDEPGRLAGVATIKLAIEQGFRYFDFLRGDEPYKAHWRAEPRAACDYRIWAPTSVGNFRRTVATGTDALRRTARHWKARWQAGSASGAPDRPEAQADQQAAASLPATPLTQPEAAAETSGAPCR